jgi:hypothetical protein
MAIQWSNWASLSKPQETEIGRPFAQRNEDGRLEVFACGHRELFNICQIVPNGGRKDGWLSKQRSTSKTGSKSIAFRDDGALWHSWQVDQSPHWSPRHSLESPPAKIRVADRLTIGTNQDHRLEVFVVGKDGAVWHIWQIR